GPSAAPVLTIPVINARFGVTGLDAGTVLVLLVAVTVAKAIAEYSSANMISYLGQAVVRDLRNDVFDKIIYQPLRFFHFNLTGELTSRVSSYVQGIQSAQYAIVVALLNTG